MKNLIRYELRRWSRYVPYYIVLGLTLLFFIFIHLITAIVLWDIDREAIRQTSAFNILGVSSQILVAFYLSLFIALFVTEDFKGPRKNVVSRGYSKTKVYFANYLVTMGVSVLTSFGITIFSYLFAATLGYGFHIDGEDLPPFFWACLGQFVYWQVVYFGATLTNKRSMGIALGILLPILLLSFLYTLESAYAQIYANVYGEYPPSLFPHPSIFSFSIYFNNEDFENVPSFVLPLFRVLLAVLYTAFPCGLGFLIQRKRDV